MPLLSSDQLAFAVNQLYPHLVRWKDFWTAHPVAFHSDEQTGASEIIGWQPKDIPQPSLDMLRDVFIEHAEEWRAQENRRKRNALLAASDWTQLADVPEAVRVLWAAYRRALRDLPQQSGFPMRVAWPEPPAG